MEKLLDKRDKLEKNGFTAQVLINTSPSERKFADHRSQAPNTASTQDARTQQSLRADESSTQLLSQAQSLADQIAGRPNNGSTEAPLADINRLAELGILTATLPKRHGGCGLGTEPNGHMSLLRLLSMLGSADLALGRLFEGHVNALILIASYGSESQLASAAEDARKGFLFGVWNTGASEPVRIEATADGFIMRGSKTFATGAAFVQRPVVTGELSTGGWQMTLPPMDSQEVAAHLKIDRSFWHPLGMESSESYGIDFSGACLGQQDLIGLPGDFYRDPLFRGGAVRFAAVHAGAILRLHRLFAEWLQSKGRGNDPYQIARLGEIAMGAQEAILWVERAADVSETSLSLKADKLATERMVDCANITRTAIERIATRTIQLVAAGVGAHGLLQPYRFERIIRDLTMYLRQPAPDQTLADIGRASLRKTNLRSDGPENGAWREFAPQGSLPPAYFKDIYRRSRDPWNFETSDYEADKYQKTLDSLPLSKYKHALEVGSSIGVFTEALAARCEALLSIDVSDAALTIARERCAHLVNVELVRMQVPVEMPTGCFDLIVISEVAYYWSREDLDRAIAGLAQIQPKGGHLVLVHYTAPVPDYPQSADEVHTTWLARSEWKLVKQNRYDGYRLDVLERTADSPNCIQKP